MNRIGVMFVLIIGLGLLLYVYNAGLVGKGVRSLESLAPSSTSFFYTPPAATKSGGTYTPPQTGGGAYAPSTSGAPAINPYDIPPGYTAGQLSPYFHQVRFGGITPASSYYYGTITLYGYVPQSQSVDITGWQIKALRGGEYIPQAVNLYDPSGLAPASDIFLKSGEFVYIYSSSAPVNLRLNKCMGYLPNRNQFNPSLPSGCPQIDRSEIQTFTGACQNYILSLGCRQPNLADPSIPQNDYMCRDYLLNHFNYRSCYDEHIGDRDFLSSEIHIWTGASPVDQYHDTVTLLDRNGLLVDYYSY